MKINDFFNIALDEAGVKFLIALPEPQKSLLAKADSKKLLEVCKSFRKLWGELIIDQILIPHIEITDVPENMKIPETKEEIWDSLFLTVAIYYNYAFRRYVEVEKGEKDLPAGISLRSIEKFIQGDVDKDEDIFHLRTMSFEYFSCMMVLYILPSMKGSSMPVGVISVFESQYHQRIFRFYKYINALSGMKKKVGMALFGSVLGMAKRVFVEMPYDKEYMPGAFSAIKTSELSLIASRNEVVIKRYGSKSIEKIFESQLALIMQSFGMYVVSTRMGVSTVDLLCISSFPEKQYTFLIEAKTTNKPYSLPRKDFRALKEYVEDVRRNLQTLPQLKFVVLVAHEPSKNLPNKLREFQTETGVPIRFIHAKQVSGLREKLVGLLPPDIFADKILSSPFVLDKGFVEEIVKSHITLQKAHSDFVEAIFTAKGIMPSFKNRNVDED